MSLYPFHGYCNSAGTDCISFYNNTFWTYVDELNAEYKKDIYNTVETDFVNAAPQWYNYVAPMAASSMSLMMLSFLLFIYGIHFGGPEFKRQSYPFITLILLISALLSWWAANIALTSQMLSPTSDSYVQSWYVYSEITNGCNGPLYIPGSGIVMHVMGGIWAVILSMLMYNDYGILVAQLSATAMPTPVVMYQQPPVNPNIININMNTPQPHNQFAFPPHQYGGSQSQAPLPYAPHNIEVPIASVEVDSYNNKY